MLDLVEYQFFGSEDSVDLDVCFFVNRIGTIEESRRHLVELCALLADTNKTINGNLAVVNNGNVSHCFKGSIDELNNSLLKTYSFHKQDFSLKIERAVKRNVWAKIERCNRTVLAYFTRTAIRTEVKAALKQAEDLKLDFLEQLNLNVFKDFGKNGSKVEVFKSIAFQLGQTLALFDGIELYDKAGISEQYPQLKKYVYRLPTDADVLNNVLIDYVHKCRRWMHTNR